MWSKIVPFVFVFHLIYDLRKHFRFEIWNFYFYFKRPNVDFEVIFLVFGPNSDFVLFSVWAVPKMATGLQGIFNLYTGQDIMENSSSFILRNFFFYCGDCTSSLFCRDCTSFSLMSPCFVAEMGFCRKVPSRGSGVAVPAMKQTRLPTWKLGNST